MNAMKDLFEQQTQFPALGQICNQRLLDTLCLVEVPTLQRNAVQLAKPGYGRMPNLGFCENRLCEQHAQAENTG